MQDLVTSQPGPLAELSSFDGPACLALPPGYQGQPHCPLEVAHFLYRQGFRVVNYDASGRTRLEACRMERGQMPYTLTYDCGPSGGHLIKIIWSMGKPYSGVVYSGANLTTVDFARMLLAHVSHPDGITFFDEDRYTEYVQEVLSEYFDLDTELIGVEPFVVSESVDVWVAMPGCPALRKTYALIGAPELSLLIINDMTALVYEG